MSEQQGLKCLSKDAQAPGPGVLMTRSNGEKKCKIWYVLVKLQEVFMLLVQTWEETLGRLHFHPAGRANDLIVL